MSNQSEVTVITTIEITDIFKVSDDEDKAEDEIIKEIKSLKQKLMKLKGVSRVELKQTKVFPNVKKS